MAQTLQQGALAKSLRLCLVQPHVSPNPDLSFSPQAPQSRRAWGQPAQGTASTGAGWSQSEPGQPPATAGGPLPDMGDPAPHRGVAAPSSLPDTLGASPSGRECLGQHGGRAVRSSSGTLGEPRGRWPLSLSAVEEEGVERSRRSSHWPRQHVTPQSPWGDAGLEPTCTCPKASAVSQRVSSWRRSRGPWFLRSRPSRGRAPRWGRTAHGGPALPASSWAPATPFAKRKNAF